MKGKGKIADGEARDRLIIWIRRRMEEFGTAVDALAESIQHDVDHPPLYRDAHGNEWNGLGDVPGWLLAARNAEVDPGFFEIGARAQAPRASSERQATSRANIDPRQFDLFNLCIHADDASIAMQRVVHVNVSRALPHRCCVNMACNLHPGCRAGERVRCASHAPTVSCPRHQTERFVYWGSPGTAFRPPMLSPRPYFQRPVGRVKIRVIVALRRATTDAASARCGSVRVLAQ